MKKYFFAILLLYSSSVFSQLTSLERPKLVVGIVVDQMRWDYLYRYYSRYAMDGGFKRLLSQGFSFENTLIPYTPALTACGHASIYTGTTPSINGMVGNFWWDATVSKQVYCTEDTSVAAIGSTGAAGQMSPKNLLTTTITDELRLATNFKSKVIGIALKDRSAILPVGHTANAAYWYDTKSSKWITSDFYRKELPAWVANFNANNLIDKYYEQGWKTLYPINTYTQSTEDEKAYESKPFGAGSKGFPYDLAKMIGKNSSAILYTPFGNTVTLEMSKEAIKEEKMGDDEATDFLAISLSSPDYIGHAFGPNSIEIEDCYLRLDKDLGNFFTYLDQQVGKGQYLLFLSSDHGVAPIGGFMKENKLPAGNVDDLPWLKGIDSRLFKKFNQSSIVSDLVNGQVYLNHRVIDSLQLPEDQIIKEIIDYLKTREGIVDAFKMQDVSTATVNSKLKEMIINGYFPQRSGDVQILLQPNWIYGGNTGATHGSWNPYDTHIPLLFYGWKVKPGKSNREVYMTDIAPTLSALLHIEMPNGCIGTARAMVPE